MLPVPRDAIRAKNCLLPGKTPVQNVYGRKRSRLSRGTMNGKLAGGRIAVMGGILLILLVLCAGCSTRTDSSPLAAATSGPGTSLPSPAPSASIVQTTIIPLTATPVPNQVYTDPKYPLTMNYPSGWVLNQPGDCSLRDYGRTTCNIVNFYSPDNPAYRIFSVDVDPSPGSSLEDYFNAATATLSRNYAPVSNLRPTSIYHVSGYKAYRFDFVKPDNSVEIAVFTITPDNTAYIFTYNTMEDSDFDTMIKSVNITSAAAGAA